MIEWVKRRGKGCDLKSKDGKFLLNVTTIDSIPFKYFLYRYAKPPGLLGGFSTIEEATTAAENNLTPVEKLETLLAVFDRLQKKYRRYGAQDTEPDGLFQELLVKAVKGKSFTVPSSPDDWELYSETKGANAAADALGAAANACVDFIRSAKGYEMVLVAAFLRDYCDRVHSW